MGNKTPTRLSGSGLGVNASDVSDQVADTARVPELVVVLSPSARTFPLEMNCTHPADELDEVVVERDTGLGVEDGRLGGADKVG